MIEDSVIENNLAGAGGGVLSLGALEIYRSRIAGNDSGAVEAAGVTWIADSTIAENRTGTGCGGLWISVPGNATVLRTTIRDNRAGNACGAIGVGGKLLLVNSTISGNRAALRRSGGVDVFDPRATAWIVQSTIVDNEAPEAGGIFVFQGELVVQGSTVAGNHAPTGVECHTGGTALLESAGGNVFSASGCPAGTDDVVVAGNSVLDTLLGPRAANGGPTSTHLPLAGSAALDLVPDPLCEVTPELPIGTDQRGLPRPSDGDRDGVARCDAGAVERVVQAVRVRIQPKLVPRGWRAWPSFPLRVLLFGSESVGVRDIVFDSIAFGPAGAAPLQFPQTRFADLLRDGIEDLFLTFRLRDTGIGVGDTQACLSASLASGVVIEGCDAISVLPPHGRPD